MVGVVIEDFHRRDWDAVVAAFRQFFEPLGDVSVTPDSVAFAAPHAGTGLEIDKDGTSQSFMPLHDLSARWDVIEFDHDQHVVRLEAEGGVYTYRVPPSLLG